MSKFEVKTTGAEIAAIGNAADILSGMLGGIGTDFDKDAKHTIRMIDKFLKNNGFERNFK